MNTIKLPVGFQFFLRSGSVDKVAYFSQGVIRLDYHGIMVAFINQTVCDRYK
jgi:hypothetical protein